MKARSAAIVAAVTLAGPPATTLPGPVSSRPDHAEAGARLPLMWLAMGDSYTASAIEAAGKEFESPRDGCLRTSQSYPQVAAALRSRYTLRNVSCGGATVADIAERSQRPAGRHHPPLHLDPGHPFPAVPPQISAAGPETGLVTIGVGGNSLGFAEIVRTCVKLGLKSLGRGAPCRRHYADVLPGRLADVAAQYDRMLTAVHARARAARVITVGYPHIIPEDTGKCRYAGVMEFATVTKADLAWLRANALEPLNETIAKVTARHGDTYLDLYEPSRGHSVCDRGANWVEGVLDASGRPALVHPNARGHAAAAERLADLVLGV